MDNYCDDRISYFSVLFDKGAYLTMQDLNNLADVSSTAYGKVEGKTVTLTDLQTDV